MLTDVVRKGGQPKRRRLGTDDSSFISPRRNGSCSDDVANQEDVGVLDCKSVIRINSK